ncbi:EthD domain-containing protein [Novosphingobium sp. B-7]|uniref:EthD domain-containing protein n=1 Tax=Novosphingobium sp. B-7 TaxID=1298855 RepID=UPI0003B3C9E2|nr:EthD domain-containing protein [Novosphingobium sp. B-7]
MLKIVAAVRRKPGMTHAEYLAYIEQVHGKLATDNPLQLHRYVQNHAFDGAYGSGDRPDHVGVFHRDSVTELYFTSPQAMAETFSAEYNRTVIAPDGAHFAELPTNQALLTIETVLVPPPADPAANMVKIMMLLACAEGVVAAEAQAGWQAAHEAGLAAAPAFATAICGLTRSDPQDSGPGAAMAAHFGGGDQPPLALLVSIWAPEDALANFRRYERSVLASGLFHRDYSYFLFTREVEILAPRTDQ